MTNRPRDRHLTPEELELFLPHLREEAGAALRVRHRDHLEGCERCRRELAALRSLDEALASLPAFEPSPRFVEAVMERVELRVPLHRRVWSWLTERWMSVLAVLLGAGAGGGVAVWITAAPGLSPVQLAELALNRLSALFWAGVVAAGRLLWKSGLVELVQDVAGAVDPLQALLGMAGLSLLSAGAGWAMVRLLTTAPPRVQAVR